MALKDLRAVDLGAMQAEVNRAKDAVLELGRDDLYAAACEVCKLFRAEVERRIEAADDQSSLDELHAGLLGMSVGEFLAANGEV